VNPLGAPSQLRAAEIADEVIPSSDGAGGPKELESLRTVLRIAFEVEAFLASKTKDQETWRWMQDTVFSGLESIDNVRPLWATISFIQDDELAKDFPGDPAVVRGDLAKMWQAVQDGALSIPTPPYLRDKGPGPDTFPADLDDVHRRLADGLRSVQDRSLPIATRIGAVQLIARLQVLLLGATLW
jgi:hypothetical protein